MSLRITGATSLRVLRQLRHDPRTLGLIVFVPCLLITLLKYVFWTVLSSARSAGRWWGSSLVSMFVVTSITMLRERTTGTLERLMTMPLSKLDLLLGYAAAFGLVAVVQAGLVRRSPSACSGGRGRRDVGRDRARVRECRAGDGPGAVRVRLRPQ